MLKGRKIWVKGTGIKGTKIADTVVTALTAGRFLLSGHTTNGRVFNLAGTVDELAKRVTLR